MFAPRAKPWTAALRTPLMLSQAQGRHALPAVKMCDGVQRLFSVSIHWLIYRLFLRMVYTLCTLQFVAFAVVCAYSVAIFLAAVFGMVFLGDIPRHGLLAHRVRMRAHHPLLESLPPGSFNSQ